MQFTEDYLTRFLPEFLTLPMKLGVLEELKKFPKGMEYYYSHQDAQFLQGDVYSGFISTNPETGEQKPIRGIILSNTCDISAENKRPIGARVVYAPIVKLSSLMALYERAGATQEQLQDRAKAIREQKKTDLFYLPSLHGEDYVALLDALENTSTTHLYQKCSRVATLGMAGFYVFLFKISVHFTRMHENVVRQTT